MNPDELDPQFAARWNLVGVDLPNAIGTIIMGDLSLAHKYPPAEYFAPAERLSGQSLSDLSAVFSALTANYHHLGEGVEQFQSAMTAVLEGWTGSAKLACSTYGGRLADFVESEREIARDLAAVILAYAAILHNARENWLRLAEGLVEAVKKKVSDDENAFWQVVITMVGAVFAAGGASTAKELVAAIKEVLGETATETVKQLIGGDSYEEIADSYFEACRKLQHQVEEEIHLEVQSRLTPLTEERPVPPLPPLDTTTFETHPRVLVPPHLPPGVDRWLDRREAKAGPSNIGSRLDA
ncbi:hypothetical protein [Amycolatopsis sp. cmx-4-68]|uniref:hypothetical protein n=1 Tax=Amycolatopsis sp. cmx-4-68 TaxID=2790938 RepID=UPI00397DDF15